MSSTLGKTESAFGVDLSHFDACEQPGINLAESSRESSSSLKVNHPQIPDFSADIQFIKDFVSMPASKSAYSCRTQGLHALSLFRGEKKTGWPAWAYCPARHPVVRFPSLTSRDHYSMSSILLSPTSLILPHILTSVWFYTLLLFLLSPFHFSSYSMYA